MTFTPNAPLLHIENATLNKALNNPSMVWISKNWETIREGVYVDDATFRLDLNTRELYNELKTILGVGEDINTVYIHFGSQTKRNEFIQVFLNKDIEYGISKKYGDMGAGKVKQTADYKRRAKLMDNILKQTLI